MDVYSTEEQQLEAIKKWWKKNGSAILWAILMVSIIVAGVRYWQHHRQIIAETASSTYDAMIQSIKENDQTTAASKAEQLIHDYQDTPYASLAALTLAKQAVTKKDEEAAIQNLNWVLTHAKVAEFKFIARTRLARLLVDQNKADEALSLLSVTDANGYETSIEELKGDIYLKQGKLAEAKEAYTKAWKSAPDAAKNRLVLRMKLEDLGLSALLQLPVNVTHKEEVS